MTTRTNDVLYTEFLHYPDRVSSFSQWVPLIGMELQSPDQSRPTCCPHLSQRRAHSSQHCNNWDTLPFAELAKRECTLVTGNGALDESREPVVWYFMLILESGSKGRETRTTYNADGRMSEVHWDLGPDGGYRFLKGICLS